MRELSADARKPNPVSVGLSLKLNRSTREWLEISGHSNRLHRDHGSHDGRSRPDRSAELPQALKAADQARG
jgi:hypothetical protein